MCIRDRIYTGWNCVPDCIRTRHATFIQKIEKFSGTQREGKTSSCTHPLGASNVELRTVDVKSDRRLQYSSARPTVLNVRPLYRKFDERSYHGIGSVISFNSLDISTVAILGTCYFVRHRFMKFQDLMVFVTLNAVTYLGFWKGWASKVRGSRRRGGERGRRFPQKMFQYFELKWRVLMQSGTLFWRFDLGRGRKFLNFLNENGVFWCSLEHRFKVNFNLMCLQQKVLHLSMHCAWRVFVKMGVRREGHRRMSPKYATAWMFLEGHLRSVAKRGSWGFHLRSSSHCELTPFRRD